ncbi:holin [Corynebacterium glutamicum]|uniref:holin n=1 Tax=Corynebacterium glutamicum TaxID=1718 RepID=UPI0014695638|nr:holin [Corynebacterium glutamicum]GFK19259.1 hypothetical protein KbCgl_18310 [Corynebacterium glutamicum]
MRSRQFWEDTAERAIKTFAQALLGVFVAGVTIMSVSWVDALAVGATAALVSVLTSVASAGSGDHESASLVRSGRHRAEE